MLTTSTVRRRFASGATSDSLDYVLITRKALERRAVGSLGEPPDTSAAALVSRDTLRVTAPRRCKKGKLSRYDSWRARCVLEGSAVAS